MNRTLTRTPARTAARAVLIAAPLALGALTVTAAPAFAEPPAPIGPVDFAQPEDGAALVLLAALATLLAGYGATDTAPSAPATSSRRGRGRPCRPGSRSRPSRWTRR